MRFVVEWDVKGRVGRTVHVDTVADSASCGIGNMIHEGERVGLVLHRASNRWFAGLGDLGTPEALLAATKSFKARGGEPAFLGSITDGGSRLVAIDRRGEIIAYGEQETFASFCPRGRRFVTSKLAVRDLRTYEAHSPGVTLQVNSRDGTWTSSCRDERGSEILVFSYTIGRRVGRGSVYRIAGTKVTKLFDLKGSAGVFHPTRAILYYGGGTWGHELTELDLRSGTRRVLARVDADVRNLSLSPDGQHLAMASHRNPFVKERGPSPIAVIEIRNGRVSRTTLRTGTSGEMLWLDRATVVFAPSNHGWAETARIFDTRLRERGRIVPWEYNQTFLVGGKLVGFRSPQLVAADLPRGPIEPLSTLDRRIVGFLVPVPLGNDALRWPEPQQTAVNPVFLGRVGVLEQARVRLWPTIRWILLATVALALVIFAVMRTRRRQPPEQPHR